MRLLLIAFVTFSLGADATSAQTDDGGSYPSGATPGSPQVSPASLTKEDVLSPLRLLRGSYHQHDHSRSISNNLGHNGDIAFRQPPSRPQSQQDAHDIAINDCKQMWDS